MRAANGSHSRSSVKRVRTPAPAGGCHQCWTSPSRNCRDACSSTCARSSVGSISASRHRVLQLVAKAVGAADLVEAGPRPEPARQRLVRQPVIDERVEQRVGRAHLHAGEPLGPGAPCGGERRVGIAVPPIAGERARCGVVVREAEDEHDLLGLAGASVRATRSAGARVEAGAPARPARRIGRTHARAVRVELAPIAGPVGGRVLHGEKRGAARPTARCARCAMRTGTADSLDLRVDHVATVAAGCAHHPLRHAEHADVRVARPSCAGG